MSLLSFFDVFQNVFFVGCSRNVYQKTGVFNVIFHDYVWSIFACISLSVWTMKSKRMVTSSFCKLVVAMFPSILFEGGWMRDIMTNYYYYWMRKKLDARIRIYDIHHDTQSDKNMLGTYIIAKCAWDDDKFWAAYNLAGWYPVWNTFSLGDAVSPYCLRLAVFSNIPLWIQSSLAASLLKLKRKQLSWQTAKILAYYSRS